MSDFAANLKKFRKQKGYTQVKLAKRINYGYTAIANYESGRNEPSLDTLIELSYILGVTTDELLGVPPRSDEQHDISNLAKHLQKLTPEQYEIANSILNKLLEAFSIDDK